MFAAPLRVIRLQRLDDGLPSGVESRFLVSFCASEMMTWLLGSPIGLDPGIVDARAVRRLRGCGRFGVWSNLT